MKHRVIAVSCALALGLASTPRARAENGAYATDPGNIVADVILVRPACLAATIIGSVVFVLSLPIALTSKSVRQSKQALVLAPAYHTFRRPLGDMDDLADP